MDAKIIDKKVKLEKALIFGGDVNSNFINFEIPKVINGVSLEDLKVFIKTLNSLGGHSKVALESAESGDNLLIAWVLGAEATAVCGEVECQLAFESEDGSIVLNTQPFFITVEKSVSDYGEGVNVSSLSFNKLQDLINEQNRVIINLKEDIEQLTNFKEEITNVVDETVKTSMSENLQDVVNSYEFETISDAINQINYYDNTVLKVGDVIRFYNADIPHLWLATVSNYSVEADDTLTAEGIVSHIENRGYLQMGYYQFKLESSITPSQLSKSLPEVTTAENGYVLTVVNGKWQTAKPATAITYNGEYE